MGILPAVDITSDGFFWPATRLSGLKIGANRDFLENTYRFLDIFFALW
jgi:hypothetical protein